MVNNHINYVEFKAFDIEKTKLFYSQVFEWTFTDYGPEYVSFSGSGLDGGFEKSNQKTSNGALLVIYYAALDEIEEKVKNAGGIISKAIFDFPGGRRFHFLDPSGNELAVWSDK